MKRIALIPAALAALALAAIAGAQTQKTSAPNAAPPAASSSFADLKSGPCVLKKSEIGGDDAVKVEVGRAFKGVCKLYIDEFFEKKIVNANIELTNTAKKPMHCQYNVAFFDNDGKMLGCASQGSFGDDGIPPGETTQLGSCLIPLPLGAHERIASYQIAFYESEAQIGK